MTTLSRIASVLVLTVLLAACGRPEIQSYTVQRETAGPVTEAQADPHAGLTLPAAASPAVEADHSCCTLAWEAPADWQAEPAGGMRLASYRVASASGELEVSVATLQGDAGGGLANVNRWLAQLDRPPVDDAALADLVQARRFAVGDGHIVDLTGRDAEAGMLVAMLPFGGQTWFVKMTGPSAGLTAQRSAFDTFLESIHMIPKTN